MGDALLHATDAHEAADVVDERHARLAVDRREVGLDCGKAHGIRDAHALRPGGNLYLLMSYMLVLKGSMKRGTEYCNMHS